MRRRHRYLRPRVILFVAPEISQLLCGYEAALFEAAALSAGARRVVVRSEADGRRA